MLEKCCSTSIYLVELGSYWADRILTTWLARTSGSFSFSARQYQYSPWWSDNLSSFVYSSISKIDTTLQHTSKSFVIFFALLRTIDYSVGTPSWCSKYCKLHLRSVYSKLTSCFSKDARLPEYTLGSVFEASVSNKAQEPFH
jgi:hypothetical protein